MAAIAGEADAVVVGAGLAGLTCAAALADAGLRVQVVEASAAAGGRARSWADPDTGDVVDIGPHVLLNKYANLLALLDRLGTRGQVRWKTGPLLTVLDKGRRIPVRTGALPPPLHWLPSLPALLPSVPLRDMLSNVPVAWMTMRMPPAQWLALDGMSARQYLQEQGVSRRMADWFWASASMALLNVPLEHCSAAALMRLFAHMLGHADVRFGFPMVGLSDLYVPGCSQAVRRAGGSLWLGTPALGVVREAGRAVGVALAGGQVLRARVCVLAVPPQALAVLLPEDRVGRDAGRFEASPYVSCYLWFDRRLTREPFWALPWSPAQYNTDFYDLANIREADRQSAGIGHGSLRARGSLIASNIIWSHRTRGMDDAAIIAATCRELGEFAPDALSRARLLSHAVHRIPMSVPCAAPGTESLRPGTRDAQGVFLAGDWTRTGLPACMESAVRSGALAAEAVLAERGVHRRLARPVPEIGGLARWLRRGVGTGS